MPDPTPEPEQPFDPELTSRIDTFITAWRLDIGDDETIPFLSVRGVDDEWVTLTFGDVAQLRERDAYAEKTRLQLADSCADWRGRYEEQRTRAERLHTTIARITALEVHGREFVDAAELYRILDKPIPPPIDHAANIRAIQEGL